MDSSSSIGVFDSGIGGLTVYKALAAALPNENFIYLGDTARLPYGTKSAATVTEYVLEAAAFLTKQNIKLFVIACSTASAQALPDAAEKRPDLAFMGMIESGAAEAVRLSQSGHIAVWGTEGTVRSGAYAAAIKRRRADADVKMLACGTLVTMAEEGKWDGPETEAAVNGYLRELGGGYDTLLLGCTHFPLLAPIIQKLAGSAVHLVDSAAVMAAAVKEHLYKRGMLNAAAAKGKSRFLVTSAPEHFRTQAKRFLSADVVPETISLAQGG